MTTPKRPYRFVTVKLRKNNIDICVRAPLQLSHHGVLGGVARGCSEPFPSDPHYQNGPGYDKSLPVYRVGRFT
jgi:hypothetical protein